MRKVSIGAALSEGLRLIRREPVAFLVWCGVVLLLQGIPAGLAFSRTRSMLGTFVSGQAASVGALHQAQAGLAPFQVLSYAGGAVTLVLLSGAVARAVLYPQERGFFYLKLGARELWMTLSIVVLGVVLVIGMFAAMIPIILAMTVVFTAGGGVRPANALVTLLPLPLLGVLIWVALRFSFAPLMSFADRALRLRQAWRLTRGKAGSLFMVALAIFVAAVVMDGVLFGLGFGLYSVANPGSLGPAAIMARIGAPGLVVWTVAGALVGGLSQVVWLAAWCSMYRDIGFGGYEEVFA